MNLLAAVAVSAWLGAFGLFVSTFIDALDPVVFSADGWPLFAMTLLIVFLANRATASSGLRGRRLFGFYRNKPRWMGVVQILLLGLSIGLGISIPNGRANGDVCAVTINGQRTQMSASDCRTLRIRILRFFAEGWMTFGWLAVAEFTIDRKKRASPV